MSHPSSSSPYININNRPSSEILQDFQTYTITIPMHEQHLSLQLDSSHRDHSNLIEHSLSIHLGLSIVEHILLRCESTKFWLKDHFYPQHHILFQDEIVGLFSGLILWTFLLFLLDLDHRSSTRDSFRLAKCRPMACNYL
jgi:hypothetical protein